MDLLFYLLGFSTDKRQFLDLQMHYFIMIFIFATIPKIIRLSIDWNLHRELEGERFGRLRDFCVLCLAVSLTFSCFFALPFSIIPGINRISFKVS